MWDTSYGNDGRADEVSVRRAWEPESTVGLRIRMPLLLPLRPARPRVVVGGTGSDVFLSGCAEADLYVFQEQHCCRQSHPRHADDDGVDDNDDESMTHYFPLLLPTPTWNPLSSALFSAWR